MAIRLTINGEERVYDVDPDMPLLWAIREVAGLTGTKYSCGRSLCGACTVHVDGEATRSCVTPVSAVAGRSITTIEGLSGRIGDAVRQSWIKLGVVQCGYCQPGQIMSASALLARTPAPSDGDIDKALSGNICRCATYQRIRAAIHDAAGTLGG